MDFKDLATQLIMKKIGGADNAGRTKSALDSLVDGDKSFDLADIVSKFTNSGGDLASKAKSWLGDGKNDSVSMRQVQDVIGIDKIESFAKKLGLGTDEASVKLAEAIPELIDKSSQGGSLLGSIGEVKGLRGLVAKFL